jgi:hypothetical protein
MPDVRRIVAIGRRLIGETLLDEAVIGDRTLVADGYGGWTETWTNRTSRVPCRYVARQAGAQADSDPRTGLGEYGFPEGVAVLLAYDVPIEEGDRITDPRTGNRWIATARRSPDSVLSTLTRVIVREMDDGTP